MYYVIFRSEKVSMVYDFSDAPKVLCTDAVVLQVISNMSQLNPQQILINLVSNAIKFTENGCVKVSVRRSSTHVHILVEV